MKKKFLPELSSYAAIVLAAIINALRIYVFVLPNKFSPGGVTGIATMIEYLTEINTGYMVLAMNIPLLIFSYFFLNKEFALKTVACIVATSVMLIVFPKIPLVNQWQYETTEPMLAAIAGGCFGGIAYGVYFKLGASGGGSEIAARFIQRKFPQYNISWFIFALDSLVVLGSAVAITQGNPMDIIIMSIIMMFCSSMVCTVFLEGFSSALKFEIVTLHPDELSKQIIMELQRGVTKVSARGGYTGQEKTILICLIRKRQISTFQRILKSYPDTFAYITSTKEVYGLGFSIPDPKPEKFGTAIETPTTDDPPNPQ